MDHYIQKVLNMTEKYLPMKINWFIFSQLFLILQLPQKKPGVKSSILVFKLSCTTIMAAKHICRPNLMTYKAWFFSFLKKVSSDVFTMTINI